MIEPLQPNERDAVVALWKDAGVYRPWNDPYRDIDFAMRDLHSTLLVFKDEGTIIGSVMCGEDGHRGWVYYLATHPDHRGQRVGQRLTQAAEDWLKGRGVWKVQLLVRSDNAKAVSFYERLGYEDTRSVCLQKVIDP
ncbi:GNAT family acetyltransferase [Pseudovibrio exalbescens]|uniref:GNAT family acetyltransferase n=1 Tax=Pseudovibrio exalbescens TaxID=197461 RepID=UPI001F2BA820|nr:GNAT family acetyltransferase [Pseudovibrio exalbescens]